jgi:uncharacterized glyoxalase superfamily protein PhnB
MYLTIKDSISMEVLDKCQATDWLQAVQYVELNKLTYLKDHPSLVVAIVNNQADLICHWTLTHGKRSVLLNDKMFQELKPTPAKARKSKKIKTTQVE